MTAPSLSERVEACPKHVVHNLFEGEATFPALLMLERVDGPTLADRMVDVKK